MPTAPSSRPRPAAAADKLVVGKAFPTSFAFVPINVGVETGIMAKHGAKSRKTAVPFGPFLALGATIAFFVGDDLVQWYLDTFTG